MNYVDIQSGLSGIIGGKPDLQQCVVGQGEIFLAVGHHHGVEREHLWETIMFLSIVNHLHRNQWRFCHGVIQGANWQTTTYEIALVGWGICALTFQIKNQVDDNLWAPVANHPNFQR